MIKCFKDIFRKDAGILRQRIYRAKFKEGVFYIMGKEASIREVLESWETLSEDTLQNVQAVLDYYGFSYERKRELVCRHEDFAKLARNPNAKELLRHAGLGINGEFSIATTHGKNRKSGMVLRVYLKHIIKAVKLLELIRSGRKE